MTPVGPEDAEKIVEVVFLYIFRIAFTSSPFEMLRKQTVEHKGRGKATKGFAVLSKKL